MPASSRSSIPSPASACASGAPCRPIWRVSWLHLKKKDHRTRQGQPRRAAPGGADRLNLGGGASRRAAGEDAAPEERAFEGAVAVHTASAKTSHLPSREHVAKRRAISLQHARGEVSLQPTQGLAREDPQP